LHSSRWKIADFGIARFVEESTSLNTLRECLTPPYDAPEQWLVQKCTMATDLYALGCIAHVLLRGKPPFPGPSVEDFREQHLYTPAPDVGAGPSILRSLVLNLLAKAPNVRPSIDVVLATLSRLARESIQLGSPGLRELARVGTEIVRAATEEEANQLAEAERERSRVEAGAEAREGLVRLVHALFDRIQEVLPLCSRRVNGSQEILDGTNASLQFTIPYGRYATFFPRSGWDVLHSAHVELLQRKPSYRWSASLWFTDLARKQGYRWYEVSYFDSPLSQKRSGDPPFHLFPDDADEAAGPALGRYEIAFGPVPIDNEDAGAFMDRWAGLLAKAIQGQLRHPERLPLTQKEGTQP
jgi:serine/threonine protein kinase